MKVIFLSNNSVSHTLYRWLKFDIGEDVFYCESRICFTELEKIQPEFLISYSYRYILPSVVLNYFNGKAINLHISLLPWNRGADPNIWSFLEHTPKGVSIHQMEEKVDRGRILVQKEVFFNDDEETLASSYKKLHYEIQTLFKKKWQRIKNGDILPQEQVGEGNFHLHKELEPIKTLFGENGWEIPIILLRERYNNYIKKYAKRN